MESYRELLTQSVKVRTSAFIRGPNISAGGPHLAHGPLFAYHWVLTRPRPGRQDSAARLTDKCWKGKLLICEPPWTISINRLQVSASILTGKPLCSSWGLRWFTPAPHVQSWQQVDIRSVKTVFTTKWELARNRLWACLRIVFTGKSIDAATSSAGIDVTCTIAHQLIDRDRKPGSRHARKAGMCAAWSCIGNLLIWRSLLTESYNPQQNSCFKHCAVSVRLL